MKSRIIHLSLVVSFTAFCCLQVVSPARSADPAQMRPLSIQANWEIAGRYNITEKGWTFEGRDRDRHEWVRITKDALHVMGREKSQPTESYNFKIVGQADDRVGVLEMSKANNGMPNVKMLYQFQGNRLLLCFNEKLDDAPKGFAANGTKILELMPYERNRLVKSYSRPEQKPLAVYPNATPPKPAPPPPQPKKVDE